MHRVQMNGAVVSAHPFAVEFERTASLHFMLFNNQQQTRQLMEQVIRFLLSAAIDLI